MKTYNAFMDQNDDLQISVSEQDGPSYMLDYRLDLYKHSPSGFSTGYLGSGPAQLALALLADALQDDDKAMKLYQHFKQDRIANIPMQRTSWQLTQSEILEWADSHERQRTY